MGKKWRETIAWAAREKRRSVNQAVGRNFLKTITEPITNSDSALKKQAQVMHAAGLIDEMMALSVGDRIDTSTLKIRISKTAPKRIILELTTSGRAGRESRLCRVIDNGPGMSAQELKSKFGTYAEAKAKDERTRSLFGRGALDVLLYHQDSLIFSVSDGILSACRIFWDKQTQDATCEIEELGPATKKLLDSYSLPHTISRFGTVVQFKLREGTSIPQEDQIIDKISRFYMLRLIAADPNTEVIVRRIRAGGRYENPLSYDFPIGPVLGRFSDTLSLGKEGSFPVDILLARSDQALQTDPVNIDRRENGLLFVDDNDAVLDLTLLPEYDKNPYLQHLYGVVRLSGIRSLLEAKLESEEAVAVLSEIRDGFNRKHDITQAIFSLVEKHVKPLYQAEEKRQKRGDSTRSEALNQKIKDVLKAINDFNKEETDEDGTGDPNRKEPIYFAVKTVQLYAGVPKTVSVFVNLEMVKNGEIVLFESDNSEIKVEPDSETVRHRKGQKSQRIGLKLTCNVKEQTGTITALTVGKDGQEVQSTLKVLGVDDPPVIQPPEDIEFSASHFSGYPNRLNKAVLIVNLNAFTGLPELTFWLEEKLGNVGLGEEALKRSQIKVTKDLVSENNLARVPVSFKGTGWGQRAVLCSKAKRKDGKVAYAKCRLIFERPKGKDKFNDFYYDDLRRNVLGDVAEDKIYINAGYGPHREIFGVTEDDFNRNLESNPIAQMRAAFVLVETVVHHTASTNYGEGGNKGWQIEPTDPVTSFRTYLDERRMKLEPSVLKALASKLDYSDFN
jgi:hypothetical protein